MEAVLGEDRQDNAMHRQRFPYAFAPYPMQAMSFPVTNEGNKAMGRVVRSGLERRMDHEWRRSMVVVVLRTMKTTIAARNKLVDDPYLVEDM